MGDCREHVGASSRPSLAGTQSDVPPLQGATRPRSHSKLKTCFHSCFMSTTVHPLLLLPAIHLRSSEAAEAWNATKDTTNVAVLGAFVARYRDTFYAELARARIEELRK